jgi:hypothetical protein
MEIKLSELRFYNQKGKLLNVNSRNVEINKIGS